MKRNKRNRKIKKIIMAFIISAAMIMVQVPTALTAYAAGSIASVGTYDQLVTELNSPTTALIKITTDTIEIGSTTFTVNGTKTIDLNGHKIWITADATVDFGGITITGDSPGGPAVESGGGATISNLIIDGLDAKSSAIATNGTTVLNNVKVLSCISGGEAAVAQHKDGALLTLNNCVISHNTVTGNYAQGAGVNSQGSLIANNCEISYNELTKGNLCGGLLAKNNITITDTKVIGNKATIGTGGGIVAATGTLDALRCEIEDNVARGNGGGFFVVGNVNLTDCTLINNQSVQGGGGGGYSNANIALDRTDVSGNIAHPGYQAQYGDFYATGTITPDPTKPENLVSTSEVDYDTNGGTPATITSVTVKWNGTQLLPNPAPVKDGYTLKGWNVTVGGNKVGVQQSDRYADLAPDPATRSITLTAQWEKVVIKDPDTKPTDKTTQPIKISAISAPVVIKAKRVSESAVKLSWKKVGAASGYEIYKKVSGKYVKVADVKATGASSENWTHQGLKKNSLNTYRVKSYYVHASTGKNVYSKYSYWVNCKTWTQGAIRVNITKLGLNKYAKTLNVGKAFTVKAKISVPNGKSPRSLKLRWYCSDTSIAKVDSKGKITAVAKGTCTVYAKAHNGTNSKRIKITVN